MARDDQAHNAEILPPNAPNRVQRYRIWEIPLTAGQRSVIKALGVFTLLTGAGWCFQEFSQLRGWVSVVASRIFLILFGIFLFAISWTLTIKAKRKLSSRVAIGILLSGLLLAIDKIAPKPYSATEAIVLQPTGRFLLRSGTFTTKTSLFVTNTRDAPVYSVFIKITPDGIHTGDILIDVDHKSSAPTMQWVDLDVFVLEATDRHGREALFVRFFVLNPKDTRVLTVCSTASQNSWASASVVGAEDNPPQVGTSHGNPDIGFSLPEKAFRVIALRAKTTNVASPQCQ